MRRTHLVVLVLIVLGTVPAAEAQSNSDEWQFQIGKWAAILVGHRHFDYDYKNNNAGIELDMAWSGPVFAFRIFW